MAGRRGGGGATGAAAPARKLNFFSNILFELAELFKFLVAILVRNHKKIDYLAEVISLQCEFSVFCFL